jgi:LacI family transcriptional regulator
MSQGLQPISAEQIRIGLKVPEEVVMVGVANDGLHCDLARPSLSSVAVPAEQFGYEAAALQDRLIAAEPRTACPIPLPPHAYREGFFRR